MNAMATVANASLLPHTRCVTMAVLRAFLLPAFLLASFATQSVSAGTADDFQAMLADGKIANAADAMSKVIEQDPDDQEARFALGVTKFLQAVEGLSQSLHKYGMFAASRHRAIPILRLPVPPNDDPEEISYDDFRAVIKQFVDDLAVAEKLLSEVKTADVKLPIYIGRIRLDLDGDGKASEDEAFWKVAQVYVGRIPEEEASELAIAWDGGDVHWLRGYCNLLMALGEITLAHDMQDLFERTAHVAFAKPKTPHTFLLEEREESDGWFDSEQIADYIAAIHSASFPVVEPQRLKSARSHLKEVIRQSRASWSRILAETDDDREWIPNPKQRSVIAGARVEPDMVKGWHAFLDEAESVLDGHKLLPFWRPFPRGGDVDLSKRPGVNLRRVFEEPRKFDIVLWITGTGATPYLEKGENVDLEVMERMGRTFRGNFIGFAIWFN